MTRAARRRASATTCVVVEDAAQAHGATFGGTPVGAIGARGRLLAAVEQEPLGAARAASSSRTTTRSPRRRAAVRNFGQDLSRAEASPLRRDAAPSTARARSTRRRLGSMYRGNEMMAAFARAQLAQLPERTARCQRNAERLAARPRRAARASRRPHVPAGRTSVHHKFRVHLDPGAAGLDLSPRAAARRVIQRAPRRGARGRPLAVGAALPAQTVFQQRDPLGGFPRAQRGRDRPRRRTTTRRATRARARCSTGSLVLFSQSCPLIAQADDVVDRYAEAFRRVWQHREALADVGSDPRAVVKRARGGAVAARVAPRRSSGLVVVVRTSCATRDPSAWPRCSGRPARGCPLIARPRGRASSTTDFVALRAILGSDWRQDPGRDVGALVGRRLRDDVAPAGGSRGGRGRRARRSSRGTSARPGPRRRARAAGGVPVGQRPALARRLLRRRLALRVPDRRSRCCSRATSSFQALDRRGASRHPLGRAASVAGSTACAAASCPARVESPPARPGGARAHPLARGSRLQRRAAARRSCSTASSCTPSAARSRSRSAFVAHGIHLVGATLGRHAPQPARRDRRRLPRLRGRPRLRARARARPLDRVRRPHRAAHPRRRRACVVATLTRHAGSRDGASPASVRADARS